MSAKTGGKRERGRVGAGVHEREEERKERPSIRRIGEKRERECYWLMSTGVLCMND